MKPFFNTQQTTSISRPDGKGRSCISCRLYKNVITPRMKPYGNFKKRILNLAEAPGLEEDQQGKPFQGKTGQLLQRTYKKLGIDLFEDCLNVNSCLCRPMTKEGNNRTPTNQEIENCRHAVLQLIKNVQPHVIVLLGGSALYSLLGHRWRKNLGGISKWRGYTIPDRDFNAWLCPTFHPSYIERSDAGGVEEVIWLQDLRQMIDCVDTPLPVYKEPVIHITDDLSFLKDLPNEITFDYETNSLKPHSVGCRIVCCSVAISEDEVYVFMMPESRKEREPWVNVLKNPEILKIAHSIKFEHAWSQVRLGVKVHGWIWDTMLMSHVLDNREGITNLAFQTYVNFGVVDFKDDTQSFLEADNKNGNAKNAIFELLKKSGGKEMLMRRCALDSIFEFRLKKEQEMILNPPF
jgi:uracil-DNA glycosylase